MLKLLTSFLLVAMEVGAVGGSGLVEQMESPLVRISIHSRF